MAHSEPNYPRIHFSDIGSSHKKEVTLVGALHGGSELHLNKELKIRVSEFKDAIPDGNFVEIRGVILENNTISSKGHTDFGKEFDADVYYQAIQTHQQVLPMLNL